MDRRTPRPGTLALVLAVLAGVVVVALSVRLFPYHSLNHDEGVYLQQAALLRHGRLYLRPPVPDAFRPWFFVASPDGLYPKYAPYPAILYAIGLWLGDARLVLGVVGAAVVGLTYLVGREAADRRTGLLAAAFVLVSPLFVIDAATFLPYAPVAALNLGFASAYLRSERTGRLRWALLAGGCIGLSFFARPYTAVLFAGPFVVHALWTLHARRDRSLLARRVATAGLGCCGVGAALAYNWAVTGHPLLFPYRAFAPADGLGFGRHALRGYARDYTPALAVRANLVVLRTFLSRWVAGGLLGSTLAAVGLGGVLARGRDADPKLVVLAGLYPSVVVGNVYFWGNLNLLAPGLDPTGGLIHYLGPYYHFALLAPTAAFAALGSRRLYGRLRPLLGRRDRRAVACVALLCCLLVAGAGGVALAGPLERNAAVTDQYRRAYAPVVDGDGPPDGVVFLPTTYGPWLNHPFQALRNDPDFDSRTVYALDGVRSLAVTRAYPNRTYYRYEYRGTWRPTDGSPVRPALRRVRVTRGRTVVETLAVRVPRGASFAAVRVASGGTQAYYDLNATAGTRTVVLAVNATRVRVGGDLAPANVAGPRSLPVNASDQVVTTVYVETAPGSGVSYRSRLPVGSRNGTRAALTPYLETCTDLRTCGGGAADLPGRVPSQYAVNATVRAGSAVGGAARTGRPAGKPA
ncbi:MAG: glycosyltransferase family 39 protein [Haloferacaceae archaeon]